MYYLYIWKKPDNTPFYVGITKSLGRTNPLNGGGRNWLCNKILAEVGKEFVLVELHTIDDVESAKAQEKMLIKQYGRISLGTGPLSNLKTGGDGTETMSAAGRAATSKRMKENSPLKNQQTKDKIRARLLSEDVRAKFIGDNNPAKRPEVREKIRAKWRSPEFRLAQSLRRLGRPIHSEETKIKLRERLLDPTNPMRNSHKILNSDPEIKAKRLTAMRSPETKAKMKQILNNPDIQAKRIATMKKTMQSQEFKDKIAAIRESRNEKIAIALKASWAKRKGITG